MIAEDKTVENIPLDKELNFYLRKRQEFYIPESFLKVTRFYTNPQETDSFPKAGFTVNKAGPLRVKRSHRKPKYPYIPIKGSRPRCKCHLEDVPELHEEIEHFEQQRVQFYVASFLQDKLATDAKKVNFSGCFYN